MFKKGDCIMNSACKCSTLILTYRLINHCIPGMIRTGITQWQWKRGLVFHHACTYHDKPSAKRGHLHAVFYALHPFFTTGPVLTTLLHGPLEGETCERNPNSKPSLRPQSNQYVFVLHYTWALGQMVCATNGMSPCLQTKLSSLIEILSIWRCKKF